MKKTIRRTQLRISRHAARRMAQRGIQPRDLDLTLRFGHKIHRTGATFYFFGQRQIPPGLERELEDIVGTTAVVIGQKIVTVYRNRHALAAIKKKPKRRYGPLLRFEAEIISWPGPLSHSPAIPPTGRTADVQTLAFEPREEVRAA